MYLFVFEGQRRCGYCLWKAPRVFILAESREEAELLYQMGQGLCAECMCELIVAERFRIEITPQRRRGSEYVAEL
ncbi:MAG: hypothetical protein DRO09_00415 [Thermoprotei archaeon]|nr:MAG: hypothetical protein DRO09_00415 [Thermoprotei archaeon]